MKNKAVIKNNKGFTLVEIITVLILLGIMAAVAVPKYIDLTAQAKINAIDGAVGKLNDYEQIAHGMTKAVGYTTDMAVFAKMLTVQNLGADFAWTGGAMINGVNHLSYKGGAATQITRHPSDEFTSGYWTRP